MADPEKSPFASCSLGEHIVRGAIGIVAISSALVLVAVTGGAALAAAAALGLGVLALVALRGCPMCWTIGLVETFISTRQRRRAVQTTGIPPEPALRLQDRMTIVLKSAPSRACPCNEAKPDRSPQQP